MDDISNQLQGKELYKHQFKQDFTTRLNELLAFDPQGAVLEEQVIEILEDLTRTALWYGRIYIAEDESDQYDRRYIGYGIHHPHHKIAQQRSFMQLLRECGPDSEDVRELRDIEEQATHVGLKVSKYLMQMMVVTNIEERKDMMKHFRDTQTMLSFLMDAFEWGERSNDFGVVYNRINVLMKYAHKEFILQVKTARMAGGSIGLIRSLRLTFNHKINRDVLLDYILKEVLRAISTLESLLSFPLLPDRPWLLITDERSVAWLNAAVVNVGERLTERIGFRVRALMLENARHQNFNNVNAFLHRVLYSPRVELWEDLERVVEVRASQSTGRIRLHVRGTIIRQYPNSALIRIKGIKSRNEGEWYIGKRIVYFYRANVKRNGSKYRCIRGKVTKPHKVSGILRAEFKSLLPRELFDKNRDDTNRLVRKGLRVYMYRARINYMFGRNRLFIGD
ncbi:PREDICTED: uncharacterized protein LOC101309335 [Fragaria vesca subsp. vesca]|uniref:uncharacterized protein LOC101309335 n=1 Tax=Fragaria vesca subsp. vesca TaxID=101020 RepID=UPI0002C31BFE|nr:PREDICTED: uncharacterized protein LOC101309335 [Fragaria vesca subsp. vesca]